MNAVLVGVVDGDAGTMQVGWWMSASLVCQWLTTLELATDMAAVYEQCAMQQNKNYNNYCVI